MLIDRLSNPINLFTNQFVNHIDDYTENSGNLHFVYKFY